MALLAFSEVRECPLPCARQAAMGRSETLSDQAAAASIRRLSSPAPEIESGLNVRLVGPG